VGQGRELSCARQLEPPLKPVEATHCPPPGFTQSKEHTVFLLRHLLRKSGSHWRRHTEGDVVGDMCLEEGQRRYTSSRRMVHG